MRKTFFNQITVQVVYFMKCGARVIRSIDVLRNRISQFTRNPIYRLGWTITLVRVLYFETIRHYHIDKSDLSAIVYRLFCGTRCDTSRGAPVWVRVRVWVPTSRWRHACRSSTTAVWKFDRKLKPNRNLDSIWLWDFSETV